MIQLTQLKGLRLHNCENFGPLLIKPLTQLQDLQLQYATLPGATWKSGSAGASALLTVLRDLSSLTLLDLSGVLTPGPVDPAAYTVLSALPNLAAIWRDECILPIGMWQYLREAGCVMPRLKTISLTRTRHLPDEYEDNSEVDENYDNILGPDPYEELPGLAACCPNVQRLGLAKALEGKLDLQALFELPLLTELYFVPGDSCDMQNIAKLPRLQFLCLYDLAAQITDLGLLHLTALTALTRLELPDILAGWAMHLSSELTARLTQAIKEVAGRPCIQSTNAKVSITAE